jgi:hypothetical protein
MLSCPSVLTCYIQHPDSFRVSIVSELTHAFLEIPVGDSGFDAAKNQRPP